MSEREALMLSFPLRRCFRAGPANALLVALMLCALPAQAVHRAFEPVARNWTGASFYGTRGTYFADLTGDGKADAIAVDDDGVFIRRALHRLFQDLSATAHLQAAAGFPPAASP